MSKEPKSSSMAAASSPVGLSPPLGERIFHHTRCSECPARLNASVVSNPTMEEKSPFSRASAIFSTVSLAPLTYAAWCLLWCNSLISPAIAGSNAA